MFTIDLWANVSNVQPCDCKVNLYTMNGVMDYMHEHAKVWRELCWHAARISFNGRTIAHFDIRALTEIEYIPSMYYNVGVDSQTILDSIG